MRRLQTVSATERTCPKPTELAITLAALGQRPSSQGEWLYAGQIARNLRDFGYDTDARALASTLARMCRVEAPWLERRRSPFDDFEYHVAPGGWTFVENRLPRVRVLRASGAA